jgi:hypothetical protein
VQSHWQSDRASNRFEGKQNMHTINCRVKQNEYQDIGKRHVTPAEALVLRAIHDPAAHRMANQASTPEEIAASWKCISHATAAGEAVTKEMDGEGLETGTHARKNGEELARLRSHYPVRSKTNAQMHLIDELFPGMNPQLPETFKEIGLNVEAPHPTPARGHGPALAKRTNEDSVVKYGQGQTADAPTAEAEAPKKPATERKPKTAGKPKNSSKPSAEKNAGDPPKAE